MSVDWVLHTTSFKIARAIKKPIQRCVSIFHPSSSSFSAAPSSGTANIQVIQLAESNNVIDTVLDNSITNAKLSLSYSPSHFSGDGSTTAFTITTGHTVDTILVFENGVCLKPTTDYTVSGTTLTMVSAPLNGSEISVRYMPI